MVEDELDVRAAVDERERRVDLVGSPTTQRSSATSGPREYRADVGAKEQRQAHVVGDDMQHATEALDQRIGELALEKGGKVGALGPA